MDFLLEHKLRRCYEKNKSVPPLSGWLDLRFSETFQYASYNWIYNFYKEEFFEGIYYLSLSIMHRITPNNRGVWSVENSVYNLPYNASLFAIGLRNQAQSAWLIFAVAWRSALLPPYMWNLNYEWYTENRSPLLVLQGLFALIILVALMQTTVVDIELHCKRNSPGERERE